MRYLLYLLVTMTFGKAYSQSNIEVGEQAPEISITDWIQNEPGDKDLSDKYIILEFWATWCGPCIAAVPHMNELQEQFNGQDIYYISITDESVEKVERSLKRIEFKSIVVTDLTKKTHINFGDGIKGLEQYPLTVLIDKNNIIKWIGKPGNLDHKIMTHFLIGSSIEGDSIVNENVEVSRKDGQSIDFLGLLSRKDIEHYFELTESDKKEALKQGMGAKLISIQSYKLDDIYNEVFKVNDEQLQIPNRFETRRFDLLYKNTVDSNSLEQLETKILQELNLVKQIESKKRSINIVTIKDSTLLEETLEKRFSSKSDADDKILFTAYTIDKMLEELTGRSPELYEFRGHNETLYDFIIRIDSKEEMLNSLASYGLEVNEKEMDVEYIKLIENK